MVTELCTSLSERQLELLPTEEDIKFYEEHGWYVTSPILAEEVIDRAIAGSQRYFRGERDFQLPTQTGFVDCQTDEASFLRNNEFVCLQNRELQRLGFETIIAAIAAQLARTTEIRLFADSLLCKMPTSQEESQGLVGWHTDKSYWPTCSSERLLTAWIPLQDCDRSLGPLVILDRSHQWPECHNMKSFYKNNLAEFENQVRTQGREFKKVYMTLKKGQISFHNCNLIHGSYPNHSKNPRLALALHLQDRDNCYQKLLNEQGEAIHIGYDNLCCKLPNGNPDYGDPAIFPVLWSKNKL